MLIAFTASKFDLPPSGESMFKYFDDCKMIASLVLCMLVASANDVHVGRLLCIAVCAVSFVSIRLHKHL
jgi:hypothetical protein